MLKRTLALVLVAALVLSFAGCGTAATSSTGPDKIVLGFIGPLTGESALWGQTQVNTVKMLVDEVNKAGGIIGKQVELKVYDNRGDSVETTNATRKALQTDKVIAFIGPDASSAALAMADLVEESKVPVLATTATSYKVTQKDDGTVRPYIFRVCLSDPQLADTLARYTFGKLNVKKCAILYEIGSEFSLGMMQNFTDSFKKQGGEIVATEAYKTGDVDFRAQLTKLKDGAQFDGLFIPALYKECGLIANQARALGIKQQFIGPDTWMVKDIFTVATESMQGGVCVGAMDLSADNLKDFNTAYEKLYQKHPGQVGMDAYFAYDAFQILKNAIEKAGVIDSTKIRDQIEVTKDLQCLTSKITLDPKTHNPLRSASVFKVEKSDFVKVETYETK